MSYTNENENRLYSWFFPWYVALKRCFTQKRKKMLLKQNYGSLLLHLLWSQSTLCQYEIIRKSSIWQKLWQMNLWNYIGESNKGKKWMLKVDWFEWEISNFVNFYIVNWALMTNIFFPGHSYFHQKPYPYLQPQNIFCDYF